MNIGITGHQKLDDLKRWDWVEQELVAILEKFLEETNYNITGISSLAIGADQLFAKLILKFNCKLHVVIPFADYDKKFDESGLHNYNNLLNQATTNEILSASSTEEESYFAAGKRVVELSDVVVAVWNGEKAAGLGGTGDAVEYAKKLGKKIIHINPNTKKVISI
jgi:uncharacterized phage-like protein YoqJ